MNAAALYNGRMSTVAEHYAQLLSHHYTWMFGVPFAEKVKEQEHLLSASLEELKNRTEPAMAVDLGSGPGFQAVALAKLGFAPVVAVDTSAELLEELQSHIGSLPIESRQADLLELAKIAPRGGVAAITCMGDTLTHLPAKSDVSDLFRSVFDALRPGGRFVLTYRDLTAELCGTDRFLPVRGDDDKVMTCFLEFAEPESVTVHDLVYTRENGGWTLNKSSYRKLRLGIEWLVRELTSAGLKIVSQGPAGRLLQIVAAKP
jgi:SAM-dependent methyltransferase